MQTAAEVLFLTAYMGMLSTIAILTAMLIKQNATNANVVINVNNPVLHDSDGDSDEEDDIIVIDDDDDDDDDDVEEETDEDEEEDKVPDTPPEQQQQQKDD